MALIGMNYAPEVTGVAINTVDWANQLTERGHEVTVLTCMPHYPEWRVQDRYRGHLRLEETIDSVRVRRFNLYVPTRQSVFSRSLYELSFLANAALTTVRPRPDAFVGIVPSLGGGWLARFHARRAAAPFGIVFADLLGKAAEQSGVPGSSRVAGPVARIELRIARSAARVGIIAEGFRSYLERGGVESDLIDRVVNRNRANDQAPTESRQSTRQRMGWRDDEFVLLHAGNLGYKQALENALQAAALARRPGVMRLVLLGDGNQRRQLTRLADKLRLSNVNFLPLASSADFTNLISAADALLVNQRGSVTDMSLPGKVTAYFAAGVPIVAAVAPQSETANEVRRAGAGLLVPPGHPRELLNAIERLVNEPETYRRLAEAGPRYVRDYLDNAKTASIVGFVESLLHGAPGNRDETRPERRKYKADTP